MYLQLNLIVDRSTVGRKLKESPRIRGNIWSEAFFQFLFFSSTKAESIPSLGSFEFQLTDSPVAKREFRAFRFSRFF